AMRFLIYMAFLTSLLGLIAPSHVYAQSPDSRETALKVEELSSEGATKYRARDFKGAISIFRQAYSLEPVPNLLYNIAKCYEQLEDWDNAIVYYEQFMVAPDVESEARQHAMGQVQSLREISSMQAGDGTTTEPPPTDPEPKVEPPPPAPDRTSAYVTLGAGMGLLVTGGVFGLLASSSESQFHGATTPEDRLAARDSGQTQALIADIFFASGALVTLVGTYLFVKASPKDQAPAAASLQPWLSPEGAGLGFRVGF
ncbi:MAG: tetratricopeptide repeat protein, partial [Bradymonadaceae bacterium]